MLASEDRAATIRVAADGSIERGIEVPHPDTMRRGIGDVPHAKRSYYRHNAGIPDDVYTPDGRRTNIRGATCPHDCRRHLVEFEDGDARASRLALG
jgi:hypothetical protein